MASLFRNERAYITFWTLWGAAALLLVRWAITDPIVEALTKENQAMKGRKDDV